MVNYTKLKYIEDNEWVYAKGKRVRSVEYQRDHLLNRENLRDAWCGRPLADAESYYSDRTSSGTLCNYCVVKEKEALEVENYVRKKRFQRGPIIKGVDVSLPDCHYSACVEDTPYWFYRRLGMVH